MHVECLGIYNFCISRCTKVMDRMYASCATMNMQENESYSQNDMIVAFKASYLHDSAQILSALVIKSCMYVCMW